MKKWQSVIKIPCQQWCIKLNKKGQKCFGTWIKFVSSHDTCHADLLWNDVDLSQVISQLEAGHEITVVVDGALDGGIESYFMADGYTSFTGIQIRAGLE